MNSKLQKIFNKLELRNQQLLLKVRNLPKHILTTKRENKWSILQILTHIYIAEKLSIGYIKKKSLGVNHLRNADFRHTLLLIVLKISQRIPFRYKAPKSVIQNTPEAMQLSDLIAAWNLLHIELKSILENLPEKHIDKLVYKHPFAGRLSLPQAIEFFNEHLTHHLPQIERIIKMNKH